MSDFIAFLHEAFAEFGPIEPRKMFGGHGIFHDGVMIALVSDECLYLKTDAGTESRFVERGLERFTYTKGGKQVGMSYYQAPGEALEDPSEMVEWARLAYAAALRSRK